MNEIIAKRLHEIRALPTRERVEEGERSIRLEKVPGGWLITIEHPETAIHTDGSRSVQAPETFRVTNERAAWERYVILAQTLGADVDLAEDGKSVIER